MLTIRGIIRNRHWRQCEIGEEMSRVVHHVRQEGTHTDIVSHAIACLEDGVHMDSSSEGLCRLPRFRPRLVSCADELHGT